MAKCRFCDKEGLTWGTNPETGRFMLADGADRHACEQARTAYAERREAEMAVKKADYARRKAEVLAAAPDGARCPICDGSGRLSGITYGSSACPVRCERCIGGRWDHKKILARIREDIWHFSARAKSREARVARVEIPAEHATPAPMPTTFKDELRATDAAERAARARALLARKSG